MGNSLRRGVFSTHLCIPNVTVLMAGFLLAVLLSGCYSVDAQQPQADTVFLGGRIYTSNPDKPWVSAIAIKDDSILYVGDDTGAKSYIGPNTKHHKLEGKLVLPGLIDAHTHPGLVALSTGSLVMDDVVSKEQLMAEVKKLVKNNPDRSQLIGGYWPNELFSKKGPNKKDLDKIESARPVILYDAWAHSVWANSKALEVAGVNRDTPDIIPGLAFYQRDENGDATGWITESASSTFVKNFQKITPEVEKSLFDFLVYLRSVGVTTLLDAGNFGVDDEIYALISRWDKEGILPVRYHGVYTLFLPKDLPTAVDELKRMQKAYSTEQVRIDTLKLFLDGVIETRTADMSEDYLDTPNNSGQSLINQAQIRQLILDLHTADMDMHIHAVGNQSIKMALNAIEQARQDVSGELNTLITICHLEVVDDEDFNRFKDLGVVASFTPHWHGGNTSANEVGLGEKARSLMRAQPLISDNAVVTFSSDITDELEWKDERANPFLGMQVAHNKQDIEGGASAERIKPQSERLRLDSLVDGYTRHAAYQLGRSSQLGSLDPGKQADLVVLDSNLFEVNRYDIHKVKPLAVFMAGKLVHGNIQ